MDLSIVTVTWKSKELLGPYIDSIKKNTGGISFEIIVVDNDSGDGTIELLKEKYPEVKVIANDTNNGYAKAMNQGYEISSGEFIAFMNPDMILLENSFPKLIEKLKNDSQIGIIAPTLVYEDGTTQPTVKNDPSLLSQILILLKLHHLIKPASLKRFLAKDFDYSREQQVDQLMGAFIMSRRSAIEKYGGWDNNYPLWWEDLQICHDSRQAGFYNLYTPITKVVHLESRSMAKALPVSKQKRFNKGMRIYFRKNYGYPQYLLISILSPLSLSLAWLVEKFKIAPRTQSKL